MVNIEKLKRIRDIDALIVALHDESKYIRSGAAYALGELQDQKAIKSLEEASKDEEKIVRINAINSLEKFGLFKTIKDSSNQYDTTPSNLPINVEQLKDTLYEQKENLKKSKSSEEAGKNRRMAVETLGKLSVIYAESDNKIELLNAFEDLKFYAIKNLEELSKTIETIEFFIKNKNRVPEDFISGIKNLVHKIRREVEL